MRLSHYNIDSNGEGLSEVFNTWKRDKILGILPLFHSFGFMTMWYGVKHGDAMLLHELTDRLGIHGECPNRRDGETIELFAAHIHTHSYPSASGS